MNRPSAPRVLLMGSLSLCVAVTLGACSASNENNTPKTTPSSGGGSTAPALSGTLNGAGSTAQQSAIEAWTAAFQTANTGVTINYDPVGSGGGVDELLSGAVQFAGSDAYLTSDQIKQAKQKCGSNPIQVPVYVSPIAVAYNLPGVAKLNLSPETLAQIFAGKITTWNDKAIAGENPGVKLPSTTITPVHRSDSSGTTFNFTDYLSQAAGSAWKYPASEDWPLKSGEGADGTSGVVAAVQAGNGTIGYADASQAKALSQALITVGSAHVAPSAAAASKVLDQSTFVDPSSTTNLSMKVNRTTTSSGTYPIILISYQMFCQKQSSQSTASLIKAFEAYAVSSGGQAAAAKQAGSAPLTAAIIAKATKAINTVTAG
ncbi:MAG: phosphate transport system substrate-binding protein [Nocardioidaceae bacterium]|nr:phosphate transport system substrate-binding protein [Nocardioidaceae bacterium]